MKFFRRDKKRLPGFKGQFVQVFFVLLLDPVPMLNLATAKKMILNPNPSNRA